MSEEAYPTEEELAKIESWPYEDFISLFEFIRPRWEHYGRLILEKEKETYKTFGLATGGWSGNEDIIQSMKKNFIFWSMCWEKSERGGYFVFKVPILKKGVEP